MTDNYGKTNETERQSFGGRPYGFLLGLGAISMVAFMAMHPRPHAHDLTGFVEEIARGAAFNGFVHGTLMIASGVVLLGLVGFAEQLGMRRLLVRAGLMTYVLGWLTGLAAASVNGFIMPGLVSWHEDGVPPIKQLRPILALLSATDISLVRIDVASMSAAVIFWSIVLLGRAGGTRVIGGLGLLCGLLPLLAVSTGHFPMNLHGFGAFVLAQAIWYLAIAVQLVRGRI